MLILLILIPCLYNILCLGFLVFYYTANANDNTFSQTHCAHQQIILKLMT